MNESELKTFILEAEKLGDFAAAEKAMDQLSALKTTSERGTGFDSALQGLSFGFGDEIVGALGSIPAAVSTGDWDLGKHYTGIRDAARSNHAGFAERNPATDIALQVGGGLLTGGAGAGRALAGATGKKLVTESARVGAGLGGAAGVGHSTADDFTEDAVTGGLLGGAAGALFPAAGQAVAAAKNKMLSGTQPSANYQRAVNILQDEGVPLTSGQSRGSNWQKALETSLSEQPVGGTPLQRVFEDQREQFQKGLLSRVGVTDETMITPDVVKQALSTVSREYDDALEGVTLNMQDTSLVQNIAATKSIYNQLPSSLKDSNGGQAVKRWIDDVFTEVGKGQMSGARYQMFRSSLEDFAEKSDISQHSSIYRSLKGALDDAVEREMPDVMPEINKRWAQAKDLEQIALNNGGAQAAEGLLPLASLNRTARKGKGSDEWKDYVNAAATVIPDRVGNSGTAQRAMMQSMITGAGGGIGGLLGGPGGVGAGMIAPMLAQRMLANRLAKGQVDVTRLIPGGGLLSNPRLAGGAAAQSGLLQ